MMRALPLRRVWLVACCVVWSMLMTGLSGAQTIAGGGRMTIVAKPDGTVWTWGFNSDGQLGDGSTTARRTPAIVPGLTDVVAVAAGASHVLALKSDGTVWAWGANAQSQLGIGTTVGQRSPVQVSGVSSITAIAAGAQFSVALKSDGTVWTWGSNAYGQLGDGTTTTSANPVQITTVSGVTAIAAGLYHTLAVKSDGTLWSWGRNTNGQLGDGTTTTRGTPSAIAGLANVTRAAAGEAHSVALLSTGALQAWGNNAYGQVGAGGGGQRTAPVAVSTLTNVTRLVSGDNHVVVRKTDGTVWGWGRNGNGQLGDGGSTNQVAPVQTATLATAGLIGAGPLHSLAVTADGTVWTWGTNSDGVLGDGTTTGALTPLAISGPAYDWRVATPVFSLPAGLYTTDRSTVVTNATLGADLHYTLNGDEPTESDTPIAAGGSIAIDRSVTLKAKAWKLGMPASHTAAAIYTMAVVQPVSSLSSSPTYTSSQTATLSTTTPGATIRYTTDGSTPTELSPAYTTPLTIATTQTLRAVGFRDGWQTSTSMALNYRFFYGTLAAPTASPATGTYTSSALVTLSALAGATIRYTTNGATPTVSSPIYTEPFTVSTTTTVKAFAEHRDYTTSGITTAVYTIAVAAPTLTPTAGTYAAGTPIVVASATPGVTIHYTLNGLEPSTSDPTIVSGDRVIAGQFTLKAFARKTGAETSATTTAAYAVTGTLAAGRLVASPHAEKSYALRPDGIAFGWGLNVGDLGDGTQVSPRLLPVSVGGLSGAVSLGAGVRHALAARTGGAAVAWGQGESGQIGDGATATRLRPTPVTGLTDIVQVASGALHSLAITSSGALWAWGANGSGRLGDGTTTTRTAPVAVSGVSGVTAVAAGSDFTVALLSDGTVWSWGENGERQLGDGTTTDRLSPVRVTGLAGVVAIAAGEAHTLALRNDGTVASWGRNAWGQLGAGDFAVHTGLETVSGLSSIVAIAAGANVSFALDASGQVWGFGTNAARELSDGTVQARNLPVPVQGLPPVTVIAAGSAHGLALTDDLTVWTWGSNVAGQLGDGTTTVRTAPIAISGPGMAWKLPTPTLSVPAGRYTTTQGVVVSVIDPAATLHYTLTGVDPTESDPVIVSGGSVAITASATLAVRAFKAGAPASNVARAAYELQVIVPTVSPASGAYGVAQTVTLATSTPGATLTYTTDGSEPHAGSTAYVAPFTVAGRQTIRARAFKSGWTPSAVGYASYATPGSPVDTPVITPDALGAVAPVLVQMTVSTPGAAIRYTLDGSTPTAASPLFTVPLLLSQRTTVTARAFKAGFVASAAAVVTYAVDADGAAATPAIVPAGGRFATQRTVTVTGPVGATLRYTLTGVDPTETAPVITSGSTLTIDRSLVLKVRAWAPGDAPSAVRRADFLITGALATHTNLSLALKANGTLWSWGTHPQGLGDGVPSRSVPGQVLTQVAAMAAGAAHALVLKQDGTVWAWGDGANGRLGHNATTGATTPVRAGSLTDIVAVAAGHDHSLALKADGTVWAWGRNNTGQLGDGTTTDRLAPVAVTALTGVRAIAAGQGFSLALVDDGSGAGTVWAWGLNALGQVGDGSQVDRVVPVQVPGVAGIHAIAAGRASSVALTMDGTIWSWGDNGSGQAGDGTISAFSVPVRSVGVPAVSEIVSGHVHALALRRDGTIWSWGGAGGKLGLAAGLELHPAVTARPAERWGLALVAAAGLDHTLVARMDGRVWGAGSQVNGRLGNGTTAAAEIREPVAATGLVLSDTAWLQSDTDGDGLPAWQEWLNGLDPLNPDTNGNGLADGIELASSRPGTHPDDDGDGVPNVVEMARGTDPFRADSDGDGVPDALDAFPLDPTRTTLPPPVPGDVTPPVITLIEPTNARPVP